MGMCRMWCVHVCMCGGCVWYTCGVDVCGVWHEVCLVS